MSNDFALVEFTDETIAVVSVNDIENFACVRPKAKEDCIVNWKAPGKKKPTKHVATVIEYGGKLLVMCAYRCKMNSSLFYALILNLECSMLNFV